ncbi:hypothetical protein ANANG_G00169490 [Anguilla anguilla]|uniref:Uncharacterized protein n=1 Tax=Anguilla anguilla TaxID=7936 RepID=A0A9D3M370_ANGAN|nr:hypothetical protein ANANG_G00169490 [Anguilla anguilla]
MEQCLPPTDVKRLKPKPLKPPHPPPKPPHPPPKPPQAVLKPTSEVNGNLMQIERTDRTAQILVPQHKSRHEQHLRKSNETQELNLQENNNDSRTERLSQNEVLANYFIFYFALPSQEKGVSGGIFQKPSKDRTPTFTSYLTDVYPEKNKNKLGIQEKGGMLSGMFRSKSPKPSERTLPVQEDESIQSELSTSNDNLSDTNIKENLGGMFSGMFKKPHKPAGGATPAQGDLSTQGELSGSNNSNLSDNNNTNENLSTNAKLSASNDSLSDNNTKEKGGMFTRMFKKASKHAEHTVPAQETGSLHGELSASDDSMSDSSTKDNLSTDNKLPGSNENLADNNTKEKGGVITRIFKMTSKPAEHTQPVQENELDSDDSLSDNNTKEKGGMFSGMFRSKASKHSRDPTPAQDSLSTHSELSGSNECLPENNAKEKKGGMFTGMLKAFKPAELTVPAQEDESVESELSASNDNLSDINTKEKGGMFSGMFRSKSPKRSKDLTPAQEGESQDELSASNESLSDINTKEKGGLFGGMFKSKSDKTSEDPVPAQDNVSTHSELSASNDSLSDNAKEKGGMFTGMFKRAAKPAQKNESASDELSASNENLLDINPKEKGGMFSGMFRKSPKPAGDPTPAQDMGFPNSELSASNDSLSENNSKEKGGKFAGIFRRTPKPAEGAVPVQVSMDTEGGDEKREQSLRMKRRVSFRVRRTLPRTPKIRSPAKDSEEEDLLEESFEMEDLSSVQESSVEIEMVEMAPLPKEGNPLDSDEDDDGLLEWWRTVEGWDEWNESSNFQDDEEELAVEQAADRVYLAAQLFVRLFNQRGGSLQKRILELLTLADEADNFHKRTVAASMGGGVASVLGSVTTITGLILAPFTFGTSIIVTAVGIGVATAGSIASASANITDTVHSNMDRKKVEKMIQGYQEEIKDIRECMEFVQDGMDALEERNFEKYTESVSKRALNQNVKHVVKEGARAGKALMINTDQLISTVQVLSVAGGAAKAAQAISVTTGVMSALFLALDIFFLAKDSHELRKGAKTQFATKLREVCKELQGGLLELNRVKTELQKTMDGIEVEEVEEDVEEEEDEEDLDLESDPVKLAQLEEEINQIEQKLDQELGRDPKPYPTVQKRLGGRNQSQT